MDQCDILGAAEVQRDEQFWFAHGDIVLVANFKIAYKVYVELLSKQSAVFRDIVSRDIPQPEQQDMIDGCPVVHLTDDPEDLVVLLTFIYDGWRFRKSKNYESWPAVKAMIVLGDKYQATDFFNEGFELLRRTFPRDITLWESGGIVCHPEDAISMAHVTRNLDSDIHACTLLLCCQLPIETLTAGLLHEGAGLSPETLYRCLRGREHLHDFWFEAMARFRDASLPSPPCVGKTCKAAADCIERLSTTLLRILMKGSYSPLDSSPWETISNLPRLGPCEHCLENYRRVSVEMRQRFRDSLQEKFGLE